MIFIYTIAMYQGQYQLVESINSTIDWHSPNTACYASDYLNVDGRNKASKADSQKPIRKPPSKFIYKGAGPFKSGTSEKEKNL